MADKNPQNERTKTDKVEKRDDTTKDLEVPEGQAGSVKAGKASSIYQK